MKSNLSHFWTTENIARAFRSGAVMLVMFFAACDAGTNGSPDADNGGDVVDPTWFVCEAAQDCAVIEIGCCDHCNGGEAIGVRKDSAVEAKAALGPASGACKNTQCTLMGCAPMVPVCEDNQCKAISDPSWGPGCNALTETQCNQTPNCDGLLGAPLAAYCATGSVGQNAEFTACVDHDPEQTCGGAMTCAFDETTGNKYVFSSTCVPPGWEPCDLECVEPPDCAELDQVTCQRTTGCVPYMGNPTRDVCDSAGAVGWTDFFGCGPDPGGCDTALQCGTAPDKNVSAWFPTTCLPVGWVPCDLSECITPVDCTVLDEVACQAAPQCWPLRGAWATEVCAGDFSSWNKVYGGCDRAGIACGEAETCGVLLETGKTLIFPSTCLPKGWTECDFDPCAQTDECLAGEKAPLGQLCVRGVEPTGVSEKLEIGKALKILSYPKGCYSSSCTDIHTATCAVTLADFSAEVTTLFCLENLSEPACTPDCSGGGFATCESSTPMVAGTYTVTAGDLTLTFTVPSEVPPGGQCVGKLF